MFQHKFNSILNHSIILIQRKVQEVVINFMKTNNMIHHKRQKFQKMIQYPLYYKYNTIRIKQTIVIWCRFSSMQRSARIHKLCIIHNLCTQLTINLVWILCWFYICIFYESFVHIYITWVTNLLFLKALIITPITNCVVITECINIIRVFQNVSAQI